jgi:PhoPQ-activated pathogenicity-related protein
LGLIPLTLIYAADPVPKELDEYLALPDDTYKWEIVQKAEPGGKHTFLVEMTSQTWHDITWKHYMYIVEPSKTVNPDNCVLFITGSSIGREPKADDRMLVETLAEMSGSTVAILFQVPNQPLFGDHVEDSLIGETLLKALESGDTTWPLLFPMTKSAIRGMDTVQTLFKQERNKEIRNFVVAGASKRGWTTWLTAASQDKRVIAIAPIVINMLNTRKQMEYQVETWDDYSPSIRDYTTRNLVQDHGEDIAEFKKQIWAMLDPYSYRSRLTLPKLLVHGTNDPYWTVDATRWYWDDLEGVKYLLTLPNAGHDLGNEKIKGFQTLAAFTRYACSGQPWPKMTWKRSDAGDHYTVTVQSDIPAKAVKLWTAQSETKDFRKARWTSQSLEGLTASIPKPTTGHIAYYIELETEFGEIPCSLTTEVWRD